MGITDDFRAVVKHLRSWGFTVVEWDGCYGRSNGLGWSAGKPIGHGNHHYVCSLNPSQSYINNLVANIAAGKVVNWFADVHGVAYLVGTGPMNHFGTGNQSVLDRTRQGQPPTGPATSPGSITGNSHYSGTECQHPGDATPWPTPMVDVMVAINAAEFLVFGYSSDRAINHYEWTNRKIDMSLWGGPKSGPAAGEELRRRVQARMHGTQPPGKDWFDMATKQDLEQVVAAELDARGLNPAGINEVVVGILRAGEFDLTANGQTGRINEVTAGVLRADEFALGAGPRAAQMEGVVHETTVGILRAAEFDVGATRRDTAATKSDTTAILDRLG